MTNLGTYEPMHLTSLGTVGSVYMNNYAIGKNEYSSIPSFTGIMAEVQAYARSMSDDDIGRVMAYLSNKWHVGIE